MPRAIWISILSSRKALWVWFKVGGELLSPSSRHQSKTKGEQQSREEHAYTQLQLVTYLSSVSISVDPQITNAGVDRTSLRCSDTECTCLGRCPSLHHFGVCSLSDSPVGPPFSSITSRLITSAVPVPFCSRAFDQTLAGSAVVGVTYCSRVHASWTITRNLFAGPGSTP